MNLFEQEYSKEKKEYDALSFRNQRRNLRKLKQRGTSDYERDVVRRALLSGKRLSKSGKTYWETRRNRSDQVGSKV